MDMYLISKFNISCISQLLLIQCRISNRNLMSSSVLRMFHSCLKKSFNSVTGLKHCLKRVWVVLFPPCTPHNMPSAGRVPEVQNNKFIQSKWWHPFKFIQQTRAEYLGFAYLMQTLVALLWSSLYQILFIWEELKCHLDHLNFFYLKANFSKESRKYFCFSLEFKVLCFHHVSYVTYSFTLTQLLNL